MRLVLVLLNAFLVVIYSFLTVNAIESYQVVQAILYGICAILWLFVFTINLVLMMRQNN